MDKELLRDLTYGMFVLGTHYKGRDVGCFVNTLSQITSETMVIALSVNKNNFTNKAIKETKRFTVSVLSTSTDPQVIGKFGFYSSKEVNKFEGFKVKNVGGLPALDENMCGIMVCELLQVVPVDTHDIFLAKVVDLIKLNNLAPMTYAYYHAVIKGSAPKNAPTFVADEKSDSNKNVKAVSGEKFGKIDNFNSENASKTEVAFKKYKCIICGHIYDEEVERVRFEDLPEGWTCPICGVGKECFKPLND